MIRVLIVDDEKLIRAGLIKTIRDNFSVPMKIFEAKNGKDALEIVKKEEPSLLITDIKMPIMDGIELMNQLGNMPCKPQIIVLSGFDDFSFAKAAIQNGALTYILKPVDKKELIAAINQAIGNFTKTEKKHTEELLKVIMEEGVHSIKQEEIAFDFAQGAYYVSVYGANCRNAVVAVLEKHKYYIIEEKRDYIGLLYSYNGTAVAYDEKLLDEVLIGVSGKGTNFSQLRALRKQSLTALLQSFFDKDTGLPLARRVNGMYFFDEEEELSNFTEIEEQYAKLASTLDISSSQEIQRNVKKLLSFEEASANANAQRLYFIHGKLISDLFVHYASLIKADIYLPSKTILVEDYAPHASLSAWISCVTDVLIYLGEILKQNTNESPYIAEALEYIQAHFTENISMAMVANHVSVNYTWFSEKFKEHTGINFNDYVKRLRIAEAKRLLQKSYYKVYEVAQKAGFTDVKYFMRVFRNATGMSPSEWAAKHEA